MKIVAATLISLLAVIVGGIAAVRGNLFSMSASTSSAARSRSAYGCPAAPDASLDPKEIPAIGGCATGGQNAEARDGKDGQTALHTVTVKFDYDFTANPVCTAKLKDKCVSKFNVYDISGMRPYRLFSVPAPADAKGVVKGITATSPRMLFGVGKHRIGVSAESASGKESLPIDCNTIVEIGPQEPEGAPPSR
jgi:hypothetical protein